MQVARAFIVRPFKVKEGIDFERVESELIAPALKKCGIEGRTTGEITRQGNIREDMFRLLVLSDVVVADVSIYNANVFYELGIRHGLRDRHTLLVRAEGSKDKFPFDLQTDRYLLYDPADPAKKLDALVDALRLTLASTAKDSPVFQLLPLLKPHDRYTLMAVPWDFQEEVDRAGNAKRKGDLRLLAEEAGGFEWGSGGLRVVGEAQFKIGAYAGAKESFEALRDVDPNDFQANYRLGTIYQKLSRLAIGSDAMLDCIMRSEQAIMRVLDRTKSPVGHRETPEEGSARRRYRAEGHALLGSNAKTRWIDEWLIATADTPSVKALRSPHLAASIQHYLDGFAEDLNSFYPGVNALALLRIQIELAKAHPDVWAESFYEEDKAELELRECERRVARIAATLHLALGMDPAVARKGEQRDIWSEITCADLLFLTSDKPQQVGGAYRKALAKADPFVEDSVRRNIFLFRDLGLLSANVEAALREMHKASPQAMPQHPARIVLFTGHMLDTPTRAKDHARFPATAEAEKKARALIEDAIRKEMREEGGVSLGIAGGACGSDILFHEVCQSLGIPTRLFLALPEEKFQVESVNRGGAKWIERYKLLCEQSRPRVLADSKDMPCWLVDKKGYDIWQRNNLWMMFNALSEGARRLTLIALYNRDRDSDGPGGTAHLLEVASKWGFKTVELDGKQLLGN